MQMSVLKITKHLLEKNDRQNVFHEDLEHPKSLKDSIL